MSDEVAVPRTRTGKRVSPASLQRHREHVDWLVTLPDPRRDDERAAATHTRPSRRSADSVRRLSVSGSSGESRRLRREQRRSNENATTPTGCVRSSWSTVQEPGEPLTTKSQITLRRGQPSCGSGGWSDGAQDTRRGWQTIPSRAREPHLARRRTRTRSGSACLQRGRRMGGVRCMRQLRAVLPVRGAAHMAG